MHLFMPCIQWRCIVGYNNYAYQCSNHEEYPHTEPHRIVEDDMRRETEKLGQREHMQAEQGQPQYKYMYPEFEGYAGEELLKEIISAILPLALARTWEKTMSFGSQKPWVGTERISQRAQVTQRKIQQDLKDLQDLGLLEIKVGIEKA